MLKAWHLPVAPFVQERKERLAITLWLAGDDLPEKVMMNYEKDNEDTLLEMKRQSASPANGVSAWRGEIDLSEGQPRRRYAFKLLWKARQRWFTPQGFSAYPPAKLEMFAIDLPDAGPQWVQDQVFYQIFPDRFARSEPRKPGQDNVYYYHAAKRDIVLRDWDEPVTREEGGFTFYGGDLDGISGKLPWLKKLGVTALYLNPVFCSPSVHKYDTQDYRHVDPQFGGDEALLRLREKTLEADIKLVLDGVFNHSGETHPWFDRHKTHNKGACHHPKSPWRDWYSFSPEGKALDWLGFSSLPKLDFQSAGLVDEIYAGENSIVKHWLREPWRMDGWRLDVVHMLGEEGGAKNNLAHVTGITRAAKEANPQAYIVGEHFGDARQWLQNDAEDAAMNYRGFTIPVWSFLAGSDLAGDPQRLDAADCIAWMEQYRAGLSHQQQLRMFNQLDSHDTPRFKTALGDKSARLPLGVVWLFTWPGVPCIYYGDEVGLDGGHDPFCRKPFPWDKKQQDGELLALYQRMAKLRHRSRALRAGGCQVVYAGGDVIVFARVYQRERVLVAINRGAACEVALDDHPLLAHGDWQRLEGAGEMANQRLTLGAETVSVWRAR